MTRAVKHFLISALALGLVSCATSERSISSQIVSLTTTQRDKNTVALAQALAEADRASTAGLKTNKDRSAYHAATEKAVVLWVSLTSEKNRPQIMAVGGTYRIQSSWPENLPFDKLIPAHTIKSKEFKRRITRDGVGVPFVAHWDATPERRAAEPLMTEGGYFGSVTATLGFRSAGDGSRVAMLTLHDSRVVETVKLNGQTQPLAADLSAYGEYIMAHKQWQMAGIKALLSSSKYMNKLGIIALERPARDRIPLVMVHGLMSRPATWQNVINELGADPLIQRHFQIYLFRYPSGVPIVYSAAKFRENLAKLDKTLQKSGAGRSRQHIVLLGHSMGGLVSKAQVQDSGDRLWANILGNTPAKVGLSKAEYDALHSYFEFDPNPNVSRVIFAATPHRGSNVADSRLAHIGRRLVSLPGRTFGTTFDILQGLAEGSSPLSKILVNGMPTSVDNLSPKSPYVKIANSLPFRSGVHLHSIIGNKDGRPLTDPECSDGFVPYSSSHLDNVESELIVRSDHSVHEKPEAIEEMRRILRLHFKSLHLN
jgi:pimeloyl-ACP methyl ester carboxylesterase